MNQEMKYRQLAMFSLIVAEVVVTPSILGGLAFWLTRGKESQSLWTGVAAVIGLGIGFYRIYLMNRKWSERATHEKSE
jgi:hypothetical protein